MFVQFLEREDYSYISWELSALAIRKGEFL